MSLNKKKRNKTQQNATKRNKLFLSVLCYCYKRILVIFILKTQQI